MKSCPSCQQAFPDDAPDYCTNDGTLLVRSAAGYQPGSAQGGQWQAPPTGYGYQPQGSYTPPGAYPPYGYPPPSRAGEGLATAALMTGISASSGVLVIIMIMSTSRPTRGAADTVGILAILSLLTGLTAIVLGIVALVMSSKNPAVGKAKGIIGICLGAIPIFLFLIGIAGASRAFR